MRSSSWWCVQVFVAALALTGCGVHDDVMLVPAWRLEVPGGGEHEVELPANLDSVPASSVDYTLETEIDLPEAWRGRALSFVLPAFDGLVTCAADGADTATAGLEAPRVYRQPGPHRFTIPAEATRDGQVALTLTVEHRWTGSAWFGAAPRLMPAGSAGLLTWTVWTFNLLVAACAGVALGQVGAWSAFVFFIDRRRRAYLFFGVQAFTAIAYPLHVLGLPQWWVGTLDVTLLAVSLVIACLVSVYFTHALFQLPRPSPWFWRGALLALAPATWASGPFDALRFLGPTTVAFIATVAGYQVFVSFGLWRRGNDRPSARYLLLSWLGLGIMMLPDLGYWGGSLDTLGGVRTASVGLGFFAFWLSLLFSQRHISSLSDTDRKTEELAGRVTQLEQHRAQIEQLNTELRRQLSDKSQQIYAALALARAGATGSAALAVGDVIDGRYRLERRLGKGGMGEVFEVSRLSDDKRFAFKIAREPDGTALARLAREAHVALAVEHENVVRVIDVDVASAGFLYIVMELVEGQPLRPADEAPTPAERTLELLRQLAEGLSALHDAGVVHRDLKPANVLLSEATDGGIRVKIADFGISLPTLPGRSSLPPSVRPPDAAATAEPTSSEHPTVGTPGGSDEQPTLRGRANRRRTTPTPPGIEIQVEEPRTPNSPALTETGVLPGTPAYIAPELLGGRENVSPAADVFAFGVIAYELLAGRRPFDEPPIHALMGRRAPVWPAPLSSNHPLVPAGLGQLVDRCLAPDPRDRPSAREIAQELEARSDRTLRLRAVT